MLDRFTYDDCEEGNIRLCRIATTSNGSISLELHTFPPHQAPDYTALSYRWGNPDRNIPVEANKHALGITQSLEDFLAEVCSRQADPAQSCPFLQGWFWIDAVCINQDDLSDRSKQVRMMKDIYEKACNILVWLGTADDGVEDAFDLLEQIAALPSHEGEEANLRPGSMPEQTCKLAVGDEYVECLYSCLTFDVSTILRAGYWERSWIIQEATTSSVLGERQVVWCGGHTMSWESLCTANSRLIEASWDNQVTEKAQLHGIASQTLATLAYIQSRRKANPPTESLYSMLVRSRTAEATNARDKLYAILGLVKESACPRIQPDYTLSVESVYTNLARILIQATGTLDCLGSAGLQRDHDVPSWVPDWTVQHTVFPQPFHQYFRTFNKADESISKESHLFAAAKSITPMIRFNDENRHLVARGLHFDTVTETSQPRRWLSSDTNNGELWQNWCHISKARSGNDQLYISGCTNAQAFSKILRADIQEVFGDWSAERGSETTDFDVASDNVFDMRDGLVDAVTDNRRLFRTARGYLGLVAETVEVGDMVCILFGSQMPVVMRRSDDDFWLLVGQAYVHGIMDGEAVTDGGLESVRSFEII